MFYEADMCEDDWRVILGEVKRYQLFIEGSPKGGAGCNVNGGNNDRLSAYRGVVASASFFHGRVFACSVICALGVTA